MGSDHHLVMAKVKIKLRKAGPLAMQIKHFNVKRMRDPKVKQDFCVSLKNRFHALNPTEEYEDIEVRWKHMSETYQECARGCLDTASGMTKSG